MRTSIMRSPQSLLRLVVVAAMFGLAACGGGPVPRDNYYRLAQPVNVEPRAGGPLHGAIEVVPFRADGLLNNRAILFRAGPSAIEAYSYHFWWQAQAFDAAAGPEMRLVRDFEVVGRVRRFEQVGASVVVEIELSMRSGRGGAPLLLKTYTEEVAAGDESVPSAVAAFSTAVNRIWAGFVTDLAGVKPPAA
jgi:ABC-type uncharacterized transport system auxiliary subunit